MSTTPSSSASVTFHTPEFVSITRRQSGGGTAWLALGHEVFEDRGDDEDGERRLPGRAEVEAVMFGTPAELHAFAARMLAAVEAEWPETRPARPTITIDPDGFRNVYDEQAPITAEERVAVDGATDAEISDALAVGFAGDFWWGAFDSAYADSLRALVANRQVTS